ncbi:MAG: hypothetical protein M1818_006133 [Claussenomyces sp. TS43310]|nr:MAG: hypothetical protein M1818_006133 [Claussenomyces sp. TS43310]
MLLEEQIGGRLDYCIAGNFLKGIIPSLGQQSSATLGVLEGEVPIAHPDFSMDNIFVDDDFNITCIIDWAFSSTVPISTLLMTPGLPHPRDEVDMTLIHHFRAGFISHLFREKGIDLDPEFWHSTRRAWLFTRLVTLDGLQDYHYFTELYTSEAEINVPKLFKDVQKEDEFVELAKALAEDDRPATKTERDEEAYFHGSGSGIEAIARKLTVMAELSQGFVADRRLWRWIEAVAA